MTSSYDVYSLISLSLFCQNEIKIVLDTDDKMCKQILEICKDEYMKDCYKKEEGKLPGVPGEDFYQYMHDCILSKDKKEWEFAPVFIYLNDDTEDILEGDRYINFLEYFDRNWKNMLN